MQDLLFRSNRESKNTNNCNNYDYNRVTVAAKTDTFATLVKVFRALTSDNTKESAMNKNGITTSLRNSLRKSIFTKNDEILRETLIKMHSAFTITEKEATILLHNKDSSRNNNSNKNNNSKSKNNNNKSKNNNNNMIGSNKEDLVQPEQPVFAGTNKNGNNSRVNWFPGNPPVPPGLEPAVVLVFKLRLKRNPCTNELCINSLNNIPASLRTIILQQQATRDENHNENGKGKNSKENSNENTVTDPAILSRAQEICKKNDSIE